MQKIGDKIVVTVKDAMPAGGIKKGTVSKAVIVRTKNKLRRKDGSYIRFDDNAVVLLNNSDNQEVHVFLGRWLVKLRDKGYIEDYFIGSGSIVKDLSYQLQAASKIHKRRKLKAALAACSLSSSIKNEYKIKPKFTLKKAIR